MRLALAGGLVLALLAATAGAEDIDPPQITHLPVTKAPKGEPVVISAQFKDASEIFAPTLNWRPSGVKGAKYTSMAMAKQGDSYTATISQGAPLEYWIEVYDELGNGPSRVGGPMKPVKVEAVDKPKQVVGKQKPKDTPGPTIVHVPVTAARIGSVVAILARFEGPHGVFSPTLYLRKAGSTQVTSVALTKVGAEYRATFAYEGPIDYWLDAFDELGNGPSRLGSEQGPMHIDTEVAVEEPLKVEHLVEQPPPPPPAMAWYQGELAGAPKTWWLAGAAGVVVAGTIAGIAAANSGPPAPVLQGLLAPRR